MYYNSCFYFGLVVVYNVHVLVTTLGCPNEVHSDVAKRRVQPASEQ